MMDVSIHESNGLGIVPPNERKSVGACLRRGWWSVNLPVFLLIAAGYGTLLRFIKLLGAGNHGAISVPQPDPGPLMGLMMAIPIFLLIVVLPVLPAWLWWSYATPKWRLWALQNVDDWRTLESAAIAEKLIWPRGSVFNLTEIKSSAQKALERRLIAYRDEHG